jgi:misacylated tRNA(Ala) deacylase
MGFKSLIGSTVAEAYLRTSWKNMTEALYLKDSYFKECTARVTSVSDDKYVVLDQTVFYPKGGGQPWDMGRMLRNGDVFNVVYTGHFSGQISHEVDRVGLAAGDSVHCILDWDRRYQFMRSHTAAHTFASLLWKGTGALISGNQIELDRTRLDFNLENFDREVIMKYIDEANRLFEQDIPVIWYELPREEALKIPGVVKMQSAFPPEIKTLRIVEIVGIDKQADGGTHVKNLQDVGQIEFLKAENKGKTNRRVYFRLID